MLCLEFQQQDLLQQLTRIPVRCGILAACTNCYFRIIKLFKNSLFYTMFLTADVNNLAESLLTIIMCYFIDTPMRQFYFKSLQT